MKDTKKLMTLAEADVNTQQRLYDDYSQRLVTTRQHLINWEHNHQNEIQRLENELQEMLGSSIDFTLIQQCLEFNTNVDLQVSAIVQQIQQLNNEISLNKSEMNRSSSQISSFRSEIKSKHSLFDQYEQQIKQLGSHNDKLLANFCPECNQYVKSDHSTAKLESNNTKIQQLQHQCDTINVDVYNIDCTIEECQDHFNVLQQHVATLESQLIPLSRQIVELNSTKKSINIPIKSMSDLDKIRDRETVLRTTINVTRQKVNPYIQIVDDMESTPVLSPDRSKLEEYHTMYNHEQFLYKLMTDKKSFIRKHLIDKRLATLNKQIHTHLQDLGLPHTVSFNNDLTVSIARMGRKMPYGGLSSGQKARLNFAICLAFRDLLQISNRVVPFLMIDEVLDRALDDVGIQLATSVIHKIAKEQQCNIFLITHKSEIVNRFNRRITVQFKDGFSTILPEVV